ncbi:hypothetical protein BN14_04260 [Rhizoctonia solani AG-1 IB]|uniref:Uncharacterized protein n=1 Tax=Thanatephorus cucumeris (strain AG1-IB / isolate 7/3/14) TaxID=1108050 RepID=M5BUQ5_THACB|nr:hypothetical protein BN14_04260 [Rhizoctonia solani AG-1 IB]
MPSYAASTTSTTSLVSRQQPRDYSAAFGELASSYGASGAAPCRPSSKTASHLNTDSSSRSETSTKRWLSIFSKQAPSSKSATQPEKYSGPKSQDFGALMDKYGAKSAPMASLL